MIAFTVVYANSKGSHGASNSYKRNWADREESATSKGLSAAGQPNGGAAVARLAGRWNNCMEASRGQKAAREERRPVC